MVIFPMNSSPLKVEKPIPEFLIGGGELGQRIRDYDWSTTSLGPVDTWPRSLRTCVQIMLTSRQPIWIGWGEELIKLYNDPYKAIVGGKHPWALGKPASEVWKDIWKDIDPMLQQVMHENEGTYVESQLLIMERTSLVRALKPLQASGWVVAERPDNGRAFDVRLSPSDWEKSLTQYRSGQRRRLLSKVKSDVIAPSGSATRSRN